MLCVNPLTGAPDTKAVASQNLGTLKPNEDMSDAELIQAAVPARCDERGFLLIGNPPELGPYVLPEIGRASWRDRVCQYVYISVVAVSLKKNKRIYRKS